MVKGYTQTLLRWPILLIICAILTLEMILYILVRIGVKGYEIVYGQFVSRLIRDKLRNARDFVSWCQAARDLDKAEGRDAWKQDPASPFYDHILIRDLIRDMTTCRQQNDMSGLLKLLKLIYARHNIGGIDNVELYTETHFGTKMLIHDFIQQVLECTILIRDATELPLETRREFFRKSKKAYGKTALVLSGGAGMGYFHIGVLKTLFESKCLPQILCGASAGSLISSFVCVRTDKELVELFDPKIHAIFRACEDSWWTRMKRYVKQGHLFDVSAWRIHMAYVTKGDMTFEEAYKRTGRILNISITSSSKFVPPIICNYQTTPRVVIWSAVLASSAFPNMIAAVELQQKDTKTGELKPFRFHGQSWRRVVHHIT